jgi:hypothetical protein
MSVNQIVLQPASVDCSNFTEDGTISVTSTKVVIVPIKVRVESKCVVAVFFQIACNIQERCQFFKCIYARLKQSKRNRGFFDSNVVEQF